MAKTTWQKLEHIYHKAEHLLVQERDKLFPIGSVVRCTISSLTGKVKSGSLYADQVYTTFGHSSPRYLELISDEEI